MKNYLENCLVLFASTLFQNGIRWKSNIDVFMQTSHYAKRPPLLGLTVSEWRKKIGAREVNM